MSSTGTRDETPRFLPVNVVALRVGVGAQTVRRWVKDGHLKGVQPGGP
jgi:excisionase family DNA binding protein